MLYGISIISAVYMLFKGPRLKRFKFDLVPNCLLTRTPIIFVSGKQSFFYHRNYFNQVPHFLREHGYDIVEFNHIHSLLLQEGHFHLVLSEEDFVKHRDKLDSIANQISTLTLIDSAVEQSDIRPFKSPIHYISIEDTKGSFWAQFLWKLHKIWSNSTVSGNQLAIPGWSEKSVSTHYLNHFREIAERDW